MRKICFILFFNLIILAAFAQKNSVKQYYGKYEVKLNSDNTYLILDRFCWNFGEYKWSGDTIFLMLSQFMIQFGLLSRIAVG